MSELVGKTLGPYEIVERLGRGGMSTVYKAYQPSMDRYVAIKVLPDDLARDPSFRARFKREARTIAKLEHRFILPVYDSGEDHEVPFLVMRFSPLGTLKDRLAEGPVAPDEAVRIVSQVAEALAYAHNRGVIHRDIKPANILMARDSDVLLTDFGIAKLLDETQQFTSAGSTLGTPAYMAPEQVQGEAVDGRTDIYALGIILYELLTGQRPFVADTPSAIKRMQLADSVPSPRLMNPSIPAYLEAVLLRATAKNPADRYQTADAMARDLGSKPVSPDAFDDVAATTLAGATTPAPPLPGSPPAPPVANRGLPRQALYLAGGGGAILLALVVALALFRSPAQPSVVPLATVDDAASPSALPSPTRSIPSPTVLPTPTAEVAATVADAAPTATAGPPTATVVLASPTSGTPVTLSNVALVPGGPPVDVKITIPGQNVRIPFVGTAGRRVSLAVTNVQIPSSTHVGIYDPTDTLVGDYEFASEGTWIAAQSLRTNGTYAVKIEPAGEVGSLSLTLYDVPPDITTGITPGGPSVDVRITTIGQSARLPFAGKAGQHVSLKVTNLVHFSPYGHIGIGDPDDHTVGTDVYTVDNTVIQETLLPVDGTYTVRLDPSGDTGSVTLTLYATP